MWRVVVFHGKLKYFVTSQGKLYRNSSVKDRKEQLKKRLIF